MGEETMDETIARAETTPFATESLHRTAPLGRPTGLGAVHDHRVEGFGRSDVTAVLGDET